MRRTLLLVVAALLTAAPLAASPFGDAVAAIEKTAGMEGIWVPFMGLTRAYMRVVGWNGVHDLRLAVFENGDRPVDVARLIPVVEKIGGNEWQRIVSSRSRRGAEHTTILAKPEGDHMRLLVVSIESSEAAVVEVLVDPEHMSEYIEGGGFGVADR